MSALLIRTHQSGSVLRRTRLSLCFLQASRAPLSNRSALSRDLHVAHRRPLSPSSAPSRLPQIALSIRQLSTEAQAAGKKGPFSFRNFLFKAFAYTGVFIVSSGVAVVAFFIYDATTYREDPSATDIPVSELALNPRRGGPKNLPIAETLIGDQDTEKMAEQKDKPRLVILGTGWGSIALLKHLNPGDYHVTVVSPTNYFLFTPMLPSATVGTLGRRSLVEPVRRIIGRVNGHFMKAEAHDVDFSEKLVEVSRTDADGQKRSFYLPYDKLVIGVGCISNPHGVKGLEHCHQLKTIDDARQIKNKVLENMELACLPTTSDEERKRLLSFVVCGGGPTGVEFASELFDLLNEDLLVFPKILRNEISVHIIQSRSHILNTYDEALSQYAEVCCFPMLFSLYQRAITMLR